MQQPTVFQIVSGVFSSFTSDVCECVPYTQYTIAIVVAIVPVSVSGISSSFSFEAALLPSPFFKKDLSASACFLSLSFYNAIPKIALNGLAF